MPSTIEACKGSVVLGIFSFRRCVVSTEKQIAASIAAHTSWANTINRSARTAPARAALDRKFLAEAGGDPVRAEHLRIAYYKRLALKSAKARRARGLLSEAEAASAELTRLGGGDFA